jgi:hypothetical protein
MGRLQMPAHSRNNNLFTLTSRWFSLDHPFQYKLQRHGMAAATTRTEKVAIAMPVAVIIDNSMGIILPIHCHSELFEMKALTFLGIALGLIDLANHSRIHGRVSPFKISGKF